MLVNINFFLLPDTKQTVFALCFKCNIFILLSGENVFCMISHLKPL